MGIAANIAGIELEVQTEEYKCPGRVPAGNWSARGFSYCDDSMRFERLNLSLFTSGKSGYVTTQFRAHIAERGVESRRQSFHARGCPKSDHGDYQGVFNQILTVLLRNQTAQFAEELRESRLHGVSPW
jgi:hypothetical protein